MDIGGAGRLDPIARELEVRVPLGDPDVGRDADVRRPTRMTIL